MHRQQQSSGPPIKTIAIVCAVITMMGLGGVVMSARSPSEFSTHALQASGKCPTCQVCSVDCDKVKKSAMAEGAARGRLASTAQCDSRVHEKDTALALLKAELSSLKAQLAAKKCPECPAAKAAPVAAPVPAKCPECPKAGAAVDPKKELAPRNFVYNDCTEAGQAGKCLTKQQRRLANGQKGIVLWMTGLSGSGKSTVGRRLEQVLVAQHKKAVYRLDGDNMRQGLNRDLGFKAEDRHENVRRAGEVAALFGDAGTITIVSLISPYRKQRDQARLTCEQMGVPFHEVFVDVPIEVVQKRDPKGLYAKVASGVIKSFTGLSKDAPYEQPLKPEVHLHTDKMTLEEEVDTMVEHLRKAGVLNGHDAKYGGLLPPDGNKDVDLIQHIEDLTAKKAAGDQTDSPPDDYAPLPGHKVEPTGDEKIDALRAEAVDLEKVLLSDIDVNWLQVIAEGWAAPMRGFMREGALLQTLHFNSLLTDPFNLTGAGGMNHAATDFDKIPTVAQHFDRVNSPWPIVLPTTDAGRAAALAALQGKKDVALVAQSTGQVLAILRKPEIYRWRQEEFIARAFGVNDPAHPWIEQWCPSGFKWILGGEIEMLGRIRYHDGLDKFRLTPKELRKEFEKRGADVVLAFQTRNPTHAGHLFLMNDGLRRLREQGFKKPVLWLSPLGGWSKASDVPLDVRLKQHDAVLKAGVEGGGLDPANTVLGIWPSPMMYGGPTEVQWHAKSRREAGANFFVVGRDPAGVTGSKDWQTRTGDEDLYDGNHGRFVLAVSPSMNGLGLMSFGKVYYDQTDHKMRAKDKSRKKDFLSISGTKMRKMAALGREFCTTPRVPDDWGKTVSCVPQGFMPVEAWKVVVEYYKNKADTTRTWKPYSRIEWPALAPPPAVTEGVKAEGLYGTKSFALYHIKADGSKGSWWHDVPLKPAGAKDGIYNFVVEIPQGTVAKMETTKEAAHNPMMQDTKKGKVRFYEYGVTFFNYGLFPQTWDDPNVKDPVAGTIGDNDPLDVVELGGPMGGRPMGTIVPVKVVGSLRLLDGGETDDKIVVVDASGPLKDVNSVADLQKALPGQLERLVDWLANYKAVRNAKKVNTFATKEPTSMVDAVKTIEGSHVHWKNLVKEGSEVKHDAKFHLK